MSEVLIFDEEFVTIPVKIGSKTYTLKEASEATTRLFKKESAKRTVLVNGSVSTVNDPGEMEVLLVTRCLYDDSTGELVTREELATWKGNTVTKLFEKALEISGLKLIKEETENEEDEGKS